MLHTVDGGGTVAVRNGEQQEKEPLACRHG
jgi:hypothetical protein